MFEIVADLSGIPKTLTLEALLGLPKVQRSWRTFTGRAHFATRCWRT
jgi:hypothetical protein